MQKTLLYLLLLLIFGGGAYYFVFSDRDSAFPAHEAGFRIKDTSRIGKLFLVNKHGESVLIERTPQGWKLNGQYKALTSTVTHLLGTLARQETKAPVPEVSHNSIIQTMAGSSTKVEVYDRNGKPMRIFYVGSDAHNYIGTYMLLEGASKPYLVGIKGFEGSLSASYNTDFDNWRDRTVFDIPEQDIQSVSVDYEEHPLNSFRITQENGKMDIEVDPRVVGTMEPNINRISTYLGFFTNLHCEGYLNGKMHIDSILSTVPKLGTISVTGKDNTYHQEVDVYWMPINKRSKNKVTLSRDVKPGYDADRYYAVMNNGADTIIIQQFNFGKILRKAYEFYEKDLNIPSKN